jgi:2-methylcitrate dehydratase PrpD
MTLTERISAKILAAEFSQLPEAAVSVVKRSVMDCIGCAVAGSREAASEKILRYILSTGAKGDCTVIASSVKLPPAEAALLNGVSGHALDYDDVNNASIAHTSVVLIPAALAAAEETGGSGKILILAYAAGFEMIARLGLFMLPDHYRHGWHSTATLGVMGACAASGKILGLDMDRMCHALGIAASLASGSQQNFGTMTKPLHAGHAARSGVTAAILARQGFTAEKDILEKGYSFARLFGGGIVPDLSGVAEKWAEPWELVNSGITLKKYPCCAGNHSSLDAMLKLVSENNIKPEKVKRVFCEVPSLVMGILHRHQPNTVAEARFSLEFAMATAIVEKAAGLRQYIDEKVNDPMVRKIMERVEQREMSKELMAELNAGDLKGSRVTVELDDGRIFEERTGEARGHPGDPLTDSELEAKFRECAEGILPDDNIEQAMALFRDLENLDDIKKLSGVLATRS